MSLAIRPYAPGDAAALGAIFFAAVRDGAAAHYTEEQRCAWAPAIPDAATWAKRLDGLITIVAEDGGVPVGFMSMRQDGYLDLAFVLPERMGQGVADAIYSSLEAQARRLRLTILTTEASHPARRFFLKRGWSSGPEQAVERNGVTLRNFRMKKHLWPPGAAEKS